MVSTVNLVRSDCRRAYARGKVIQQQDGSGGLNIESQGRNGNDIYAGLLTNVAKYSNLPMCRSTEKTHREVGGYLPISYTTL